MSLARRTVRGVTSSPIEPHTFRNAPGVASSASAKQARTPGHGARTDVQAVPIGLAVVRPCADTDPKTFGAVQNKGPCRIQTLRVSARMLMAADGHMFITDTALKVLAECPRPQRLPLDETCSSNAHQDKSRIASMKHPEHLCPTPDPRHCRRRSARI